MNWRESSGGPVSRLDLATFWRCLATFGVVWRCLAMFGDGTHQTAAHLAHGTSLVVLPPSPVSRFVPFFALSYPGTFTLAGGGMPMRLSTVEFGARLELNALFPQHEHIAMPSVFGTPPCVLAALAFAVALALCLAWVETPICVGLVRGSAVGNDGGGRTAGRLARAGAVAAAVTVLIAVTTPPELRCDASGRVATSSSSAERSTSSRASSSSSSHHRVTRSSSSTTRAGGGDGARSPPPRRPVSASSPRAARALAPARSKARLRASACLAARIAAAAASSSAASSLPVDASADSGDDAPDRLDMVASLTCGAHPPDNGRAR